MGTCRLTAAALTMLSLGAGGCMLPNLAPSGRPMGLYVSPDGGTLAYVYQRNLMTYPHVFVWEEHYVRWARVDHPGKVRSVLVAAAGSLASPDTLEALPHLVFSPDSTRLAVACDGGVKVIDLASGELTALSPPDEVVTSLRWAADDEVVYVSHRGYVRFWERVREGKGYGPTERTVWRQKVGTGAAARTVIHRQEGVETRVSYFDWRRGEDICPRGRLAVLFDSEPADPGSTRGPGRLRIVFSLLDLSTGRTRPLVRGGAGILRRTAWKPDGSALAIMFSDLRGPRPYRAVLYEPASDRTDDFSEPLNRALQRSDPGIDMSDMTPSLGDMAWTADGKFLALNVNGGQLIRPRPFKAIHIGQSFGQALVPDGGFRTEVLPTAVPGWVLGYGDREGGRIYAVNYLSFRYVQLADNPQRGAFAELTEIPPQPRHETHTIAGMMWPSPPVVLLPNGRLFATIDFDESIRLHDLDLSAPPDRGQRNLLGSPASQVP